MLNYKEISKNDSKKCLICEKENLNTGITILGNFICEKCISDINRLTVDDEKYDLIKDKLKGILTNYL